MSSALTTSSAAMPSTTAVCANIKQTPNSDRNCAMQHTDKNVDYMKKCCKKADVVSYYDNCGVYCLAVGQTIDDLVKCLKDEGAGDNDIFCSGPGKDSATATDVGTLDPTLTASIISSGSTGSPSDDKDDGKGDGGKDGDDKGAAAKGSVSVLGLAVGTLLLSAFTMGGI